MKQLTLLAMALCMLAACSKSNNDPANTNPSTQQPTDNLTEDEQKLIGSWRLELVTDTTIDKSGKVTYGAGLPRDCAADDIYTFLADKTYTIDQGKDTCDKNIVFGPFEWSAAYGGLNYDHGPNPGPFANSLTITDKDHFNVLWSTQGWNGQERYVYFYVRVQ